MPSGADDVGARSVWTGPRRQLSQSEPGAGVAVGGSSLVGLLALDAGLGLGVGELGLEGLLGDLRGDVDDEGLGVGDERGALGQLDLAREDLRAGLEALDRDGDALGDVGGLDLELEARAVGGDHGVGSSVTLDVDRDVDGDLLALEHDDQVDVLDDRLDRVALHVLGQGELLLAVEDDGEQGVARLERLHRLVGSEGDVHRVGTVAVHDGGDLVVAADLASRALAELGAGLGVQGEVGHGGAP